MAKAWNNFPGAICLILSGNDYTAKELLEHQTQAKQWREAMNHPRLSRHDLPEADHTFSGEPDRQAAESLTVVWLSESLPQ